MLSPKKWLRCVCVFSFICGVVVPFLLFLVTNTYDILDTERSGPLEVRRDWEGRLYSPRRPLEVGNPEDVQLQMEELQRIVVSVRNELRRLEHERNRLKKEIDQSKITLSKVRKEVSVAKSSLQESKGKLAKSLRESKKAMRSEEKISPSAKSDIVVVNLPAKSAAAAAAVAGDAAPPPPPASPEAVGGTRGEGRAGEHCTDQTCFDYSKCPLTAPFSVYIYNQHHPDLFDLTYPELVDDLVSSLQLKHSLVSEPDSACIFVVIVGPLKAEVEEAVLKQRLEALSHWRGSGSNHVVVDLPYLNWPLTTSLLTPPLAQGAIVAKGGASAGEEKGFNILLPPVTRHGENSKPFWKSIRPLLPAMRQYLVVHEGFLRDYKESEGRGEWIDASRLSSWRDAVAANSRDKVLISVKCNGTASQPSKTGGAGRIWKLGEWELCGTPAQRATLLSNATFSLVLGSQSGTVGPETFTRLIEGLRYGAIPVILGLKHLPFDSIINWRNTAVVLPSSALGQLHLILRNIAQDDVLRYRRQGRFLWDTYFSSPLQILDTAVAIVRQKALHPPAAATPHISSTLLATIPGENYATPSPEYVYNFTLYSEKFWNSAPGPFYMYPTTPFKPAPVSGSQYVDREVSSLPQHVIDAGGITGPFFEDYLLGNTPEEQFTIVLLTYERNDVLLAALERLKDLDHLAKVVVVWNNPNPPPRDMQWPDIGITIDIVSVGRNSLNNRFLPFSNIHTEAVLSIDDDVHLRHDEIQFAFRVWREARDRVVGFPGRFHAWDTRHSSWLYNSNYTCELSMVLTGAAFLHKYYMFLYSHWLYREARVMVDKYMNCEDIAMNFLVSHITRKPPLKVTSRWTFRCPGCPEALSSSEVHFNERHICINQLVEMFGYMPLLYTQFRLDSVLFKTRISSHLEKCYEFI